MDWTNPMKVFGFDDEPVAQDGDVYDDNDDFYGNENVVEDAQQEEASHASVKPKQNTVPNNTLHLISTDEKTMNQKRAEMLRAKLLAQRQNTPSKPASRAGTPAKVNNPPQQNETPSGPPIVPPKSSPPMNNSTKKEEVKQNKEPSSDATGLEALLTEGKALADAKTAALRASSDSGAVPNGDAQDQNSSRLQQTPAPRAPAQEFDEHPKRPADLSHQYYADLPAWLEITGYHDVKFRNSKLSTYKERVALEKEAARIAERLEKLRQLEQDNMQSLRLATPVPTPSMAPPSLPAKMPDGKATPKINGINGTNVAGVKRPRSPEILPAEKSRRRETTGGFGIRGASVRGSNESPIDTRPPPSRRQPSRTPSPVAFERRVSYPDARRRSIDDVKPPSRDASLERRKTYYRRDGDAAHYDSYTPREPHPRPSYGANTRNNSIPRPQQYRASVPLDLRKGGVRYFMIKSWNHENVVASQRDNLWATQAKNEALLRDAFNTSRHVILLFSVNKSVGFQGYALMTSAPDATLPKPDFCLKLKWDTSPAFTVRWLGTTPIHFRLIGHLKNTLNIDEQGDARAVLVGKDGQEISADAAMGVVWALDEAEVSADGMDTVR